MRHGNEREEFETGAQRDTDEGKGKPSLISPVLIHRLGVLLAEGAKHYGADNWTKGMKYRRTADSMIRHIFQWLAGDEEEDHLAAVVFGAMCLMTYEEQARNSNGHSLDDRDPSLKEILHSILTSAPPDATLETMAPTHSGSGEVWCPVCKLFPILRDDMMCRACLLRASYTRKRAHPPDATLKSKAKKPMALKYDPKTEGVVFCSGCQEDRVVSKDGHPVTCLTCGARGMQLWWR